MTLEFLHQENHEHLVLFYAGWGMDSIPFLPFSKPSHDVAIVYDYSSLDIDFTPLENYKTIDILGWSMGVWAASMSAQPLIPRLGKTTAFNGTLMPINDAFGISNSFYEASIKSMDRSVLERFYRLMCGLHVKDFLIQAPNRSIDSLTNELIAIKTQSSQKPLKKFEWDYVVIGQKDRIFNPQNQLQAWDVHPNIKLTQLYHYDANFIKKALYHE